MVFPKGLIALAAVAALLLAGCGSGGGGGASQDYSTGTQGLTMEFMQSSPPACPRVIYEGEQTEVEMRVRNRGAFATGGRIYLSGYDPAIVTGLNGAGSPYTVPSLEGKSQALPEGGMGDVTDTLSLSLPSGVEQYDANILADLCYNYKTTASLQVCVDPTPSDPEGDACKAGVLAGVSGGQGAPVGITNVGMESSSSRTTFLITIANKDGGKVYSGSECRDIAPENEDMVAISTARISQGTALDCTPAGSVRLYEGGSANIECKFNHQGTTAYATTLTLELNYGYKKSQSVKICGRE
ncbi:hypothetical protein J4439_06805 [Candidatus Woesearchaeota archaeon]|nr:hypothetical protein [Candidatus Woesearchaeota archaeon]